MPTLRFEAETINRSIYRLEPGSFASNDQFIGLAGGGLTETGTASFSFSGPSGLYKVVVGYFDEGDGASRLEVRKQGTLIDAWNFSKDLGSNLANEQTRTSRTIASNLSVNAGEKFVLRGSEDRGEPARIDYIEFISVTPTAINGTSAADTLVGNAKENTINGFGGNDTLIGGAGDDRLNGGTGSDTADYTQAARGIIANLNKGLTLAPKYGTLAQPKIMPLGDSITEGEHSFSPTPGAYRTQLWKDFLADGLSINFVGSRSNGPGSLGDKDHEGHGGWKIDQITGLVNDGLLATYRPNVILLMIGANDTRNSSVGEMRADLSNLIDQIAGRSPSTQLVVTSITPKDPSVKGEEVANRVKAFNAILPDLISDKADQGKKVSFVNVGGKLTLSDILPDGVHPDAQGYNKLGDLWYDSLVERDRLTSIENIIGTTFDDKLAGNTGINYIKGGAGDDILTGGGNTDTFGYGMPTQGRDTITDFGSDFFRISASGFGGGLQAGTALSTNNSGTGVFVKGANPTSKGTSANFLYNTNTGLLRFDVDGTESGAAVAIATLTGVPSLNANQFAIFA